MSILDGLWGQRAASEERWPDQATTGSHSRVFAGLGVVLGVPACLLLLLLIRLGVNAPPADAFSATNPGSQDRLARPRVASPVWTITGENGGDGLGYSAAIVGDLNDDGYAGVILGAFGQLGKVAGQWAVALAPASAAQLGDPGATVTYALVLTNEGDGLDTFVLTVGSTAFTTTVMPSIVGPLRAGASRSVTVIVEIPAGAAAGVSDAATVTATSRRDASQSASSTLTTRVNAVRHVALAPASAAQSGDPGTTITYTLVLTNAGNTPDTFMLTMGSTAFTTTVAPSSVGPLGAEASRSVTVMVQIPAGAAAGVSDTATLTATSQGDASQSAHSTLTTTVNMVRRVSLAPPTAAQSGDPGATVTYTLVLTNAGNGSDTFTLTVGSTAFTTTVMPSSVGPLGAGASRRVTVTVQIPAGAAAGVSDTATLTATSQGDVTQSANAVLATMTAAPAGTARGVYLPLVQKIFFCDQYEPNDRRPINGGAPWGPLVSGQTIQSQICPGDPRDLYYFNAGGAVQVTIDVTNVPGNADFGLYLWDESGTTSLAGSRKGAGQNEHIVCTLPRAGRYYVDVYPWSGSGPYTLQGSGW